jgi:hypothetical protein
MGKKTNAKKLEKLLRLLIKGAAVALTAPATWAVAGRLYAGWFQSLIVQAAALVLVEGALLLGWHLLDADAGETTLQRGVYAGITLIAYGVLWAVAWAHGEGWAGIAFRATLGVLVIYSVIEAAVRAGIKINAKASGDILAHRAVKNDWRRKAKEDAIAENSTHFEIERAKRAARLEVEQERIKLLKKKLLDELPASIETSPNQSQPDGPKMAILEAQAIRVERQQLTKPEAVAAVLDHLRDNPATSVRDLATLVSKSSSTISRYMQELEDAGQIARNNGTTIVLAD